MQEEFQGILTYMFGMCGCACVQFQHRSPTDTYFLCFCATTFDFLHISICYMLQFISALSQTILFNLLLASVSVCIMFLSHLSDMCVICFVLYTCSGDLLLPAEYILCCLVSFQSESRVSSVKHNWVTFCRYKQSILL